MVVPMKKAALIALLISIAYAIASYDDDRVSVMFNEATDGPIRIQDTTPRYGLSNPPACVTSMALGNGGGGTAVYVPCTTLSSSSSGTITFSSTPTFTTTTIGAGGSGGGGTR